MASVPAAKGVEAEVLRESIEGSWPLLKRERTWGRSGVYAVTISAGIAGWAYAIGGAVAYYLPAWAGIFAMFGGALLGTYIVFYASVPVSVKYGLDTIAATKPAYGTRGSIVTILMQYIAIIGWNCILLILVGKSVGEVLVAGGVISEGSQFTVQVIASLVVIGITFGLLWGGASRVRSSSMVIAALVLAAGIILFVFLVVNFGFSAIGEAKPLYSTGDKKLDFTLGFEVFTATLLTWWPYMGSIMRMARSGGEAKWPALLCLGGITAAISLLGLFAALVTQSSDPAVYMVKVAGVWGGALALAFVALANVGTAIVGVYVTAVGLKQIPALQYRMGWKVTIAVVLIPVAIIAATIPNLFFEKIGQFLSFQGMVFGPICGVMIIDYFVFRKSRLHLPSLYDYTSRSRYHYWGGVNWIAIVATGAGIGAYYYLLNPYWFTSRQPFEWTTASIPSVLVGMLAHWVLTKAIVMPAKKGGY